MVLKTKQRTVFLPARSGQFAHDIARVTGYESRAIARQNNGKKRGLLGPQFPFCSLDFARHEAAIAQLTQHITTALPAEADKASTDVSGATVFTLTPGNVWMSPERLQDFS